jgi:hypothetical protein
MMPRRDTTIGARQSSKLVSDRARVEWRCYPSAHIGDVNLLERMRKEVQERMLADPASIFGECSFVVGTWIRERLGVRDGALLVPLPISR